MRYGVVVPALIKDVLRTPETYQPIRYFVEKGVPVALVVNGGTMHSARACERRFDTASHNFWLLYGGEDANPYPSRNVGLRHLFDIGVDAVVLVDSDTHVSEDYHEQALRLLDRNKLVAGRITTKVPRGVSRHLDWLNEIGFECFDGFSPPGATIGANMVIGRSVYASVGDMLTTAVSGGDADYAARARAIGIQVVQHNELVVSKVISSYSYRVIVEKQLRRALCLNPSYAATQKDTINCLRASLRKHLDALEGADSVEDLKPHYGELIDSLFALMWFEGQLANHIDRETK